MGIWDNFPYFPTHPIFSLIFPGFPYKTRFIKSAFRVYLGILYLLLDNFPTTIGRTVADFYLH